MDLAQPTPGVDVIGVDVAKGWIDGHRLSSGQRERVPTTRQELARFARRASSCLVVLEASGGYERPLLDALARAGVAFRVVNPRQARDFARATGRLAKTDQVDARVLAEMGRTLALTPSPPPEPERERLAALLARREDLVAMSRAEANRLAQAATADLRRDITSHLRVLKAHLLLVERRMADCVADSAPLAQAAARLSTVKGIGPVTAAALLARLPELGRLDRRSIAALGLPRSAGLRLRAAPRPAPHLGRARQHPARPLPRRPHCLALRPHHSRLPKPPPGPGQTHQGHPHRLRPQAPHHPQCHDAGRNGLQQTARLKDSCYSPDLNPIEMAFAKLKAHLRRLEPRSFGRVFEALGSICDLFTPTECQNYFRAAGYASD